MPSPHVMKSLFISLLTVIPVCLFAQVKVYKGEETIPTYKLGPDIKSPLFYTGRGVQGAAGHIYPYPAQTDLGDSLSMETYAMVYLENEYLKVTILPQFGGKIFSAIDKTNGHELFHRNSTVKPDLIGTLGAWISGGIEWCFPHHHRATTLMPADYSIVKNSDGSATVWVGETERSCRLRSIIGITLRPGCAYIETEYRLNNPTEITQNFLFWANVAITANKDFRTFWPPSQEIGVFHSNASFTHWPISHEVYTGIDYTSGVDLTWWKNHPDPVSFFFWRGKEGFIGGYDYAQRAGTVHVGDVIENRTSKLWQFGPGLLGQNARRKLTDDGKAYVELMTGTFSDNQPGYGWFAPHSVRQAKNFWYPIRDLEVVKNATLDASVTLQLRNPKTVFYGFNTTRTFKKAVATLKYGDVILETKTIDIDPAKPFTATYKSNKNLDEYQLWVELKESTGVPLISYAPYKPQNPELPAAQQRTTAPGELDNVEDLYLTGRYVEQFSKPGPNPDDYYHKALTLSPNDYRVNIALGIRRIKQWRYAEAERYLNTASDRLKATYAQPKEGELFYYLGLAQQALGKRDEAYRNFSEATWYYEWQAAAFYQLALLESQQGHYARALELVEKAYGNSIHDGKIQLLYSALARKTGQREKALEIIENLIRFDPINFAATYEHDLITDSHSLQQLHPNMQDVDNNYIEIAVNYLHAGMWDEGIGLLSSLKEPANPLVNYYLAWFYAQKKELSKASEELKQADKKSLTYCFPYRYETETVLQFAIEKSPSKAIPYYLLGNLLYDNRPDEAIAAWEKSREADQRLAMVWRNLAFGAFHHGNDIRQAKESMNQAIALDPNQPLWYRELAEYSDLAGSDLSACIKTMTENIKQVKEDINAPKSLVKFYNLRGEYETALNLLETHHFRTWEGGRDIYYHYVDTHTLKALTLMKGGNPGDALKELEKAMLYPENLEVGKPLHDDHNAMIWYYMGRAYEALKEPKKANEYYTKSAKATNPRNGDDLIFYQGQSYEKLQESEKARKFYNDLIERGDQQLARGTVGAGIGVEEQSTKANRSVSEAYYLKALGTLGLGNREEAVELFNQALKAYPNNLWAKTHLNSLN